MVTDIISNTFRRRARCRASAFSRIESASLWGKGPSAVVSTCMLERDRMRQVSMALEMALVGALVLAAALVIIHHHAIEHFTVHHHHLNVLRAHHRRGTVRSPLEQTWGERVGRRCEHLHAVRARSDRPSSTGASLRHAAWSSERPSERSSARSSERSSARSSARSSKSARPTCLAKKVAGAE